MNKKAKRLKVVFTLLIFNMISYGGMFTFNLKLLLRYDLPH